MGLGFPNGMQCFHTLTLTITTWLDTNGVSLSRVFNRRPPECQGKYSSCPPFPIRL